jgi:hypothetical protein
MESVKQACTRIGLNVVQPVSLLHGFFGFLSNQPPQAVSLRQQVLLVSGKHVHMNLITVGDYNWTELLEAERALQITRDKYAQVNLGVGRVEWYTISAAAAGGRDNIDSDGEAEALTDEWTVPNHALDIFFVKTYAGSTIGLSRVDGPCDKDAEGMDGSVVAIESSPDISGLVMAHEAGHYLGLSHVNDSTNLMNPSVPNGGGLTAGQGNNMKDHCFVNG